MKHLVIFFLGLLVFACSGSQANAQIIGFDFGIRLGGGAFQSAGALEPSRANQQVLENFRCPNGINTITDTGIEASAVDERTNAQSNWVPRRGDSPYNRANQGSFQRDSERTFSRRIVCEREGDRRERTIQVVIRRFTFNGQGNGFNRDERVSDTGWQQVRQGDGW